MNFEVIWTFNRNYPYLLWFLVGFLNGHLLCTIYPPSLVRTGLGGLKIQVLATCLAGTDQ